MKESIFFSVGFFSLGRRRNSKKKPTQKKKTKMPRAGPDARERANAHLRWAERYNRSGDPEKARAHFGRALKYDSAFGPIGPSGPIGPIGPVVSLGSAVGAAALGASGPTSVVPGSGPSPSSSAGAAAIERARAANAQNAPNYADRVNAARKKTAYAPLPRRGRYRGIDER